MSETTGREALAARIAEAEWAWGWHEDGAIDPDGHEHRAGYGHHMAQMLYLLPRDGQTRDMEASIRQMLDDLRALAVVAERFGIEAS